MTDPITKQLKEIEQKEKDRKKALTDCDQALIIIERAIDKGQSAEVTVIGLLTVIQKMVEVLK